jgi:hypothetical protein
MQNSWNEYLRLVTGNTSNLRRACYKTNVQWRSKKYIINYGGFW